MSPREVPMQLSRGYKNKVFVESGLNILDLFPRDPYASAMFLRVLPEFIGDPRLGPDTLSPSQHLYFFSLLGDMLFSHAPAHLDIGYYLVTKRQDIKFAANHYLLGHLGTVYSTGTGLGRFAWNDKFFSFMHTKTRRRCRRSKFLYLWSYIYISSVLHVIRNFDLYTSSCRLTRYERYKLFKRRSAYFKHNYGGLQLWLEGGFTPHKFNRPIELVSA